ncbi:MULTISPECIES: HIT family protein [unclassified Rhodococcus (in: high G+C Gram-positive bacteria)]|uniref:HIT family protein n=1 Tax=unclassified Rhodococcus (in: high G+C Gram-positive bacteria) TaxID=192944 RepID=UPI001595D4F4|nr:MULTISPECIES: HIT domain-containing protein [unclassified Rhodococcus (in: high G+C Gram-positive bacteria)]
MFCRRIAAGEYDRTTVNAVVSFEPLNPVVPGHRLFVPVEHAEDAAASPWRAGSACMAAAEYVRHHEIDANIITSIGAAATQTIRHTHVHVVPRALNDGLALPWTGQKRDGSPT